MIKLEIVNTSIGIGLATEPVIGDVPMSYVSNFVLIPVYNTITILAMLIEK